MRQTHGFSYRADKMEYILAGCSFPFNITYAPVAQWIEQDGSNVKVVGSNPARGTNLFMLIVLGSILE